jgi:hypothetical protein
MAHDAMTLRFSCMECMSAVKNRHYPRILQVFPTNPNCQPLFDVPIIKPVPIDCKMGISD